MWQKICRFLSVCLRQHLLLERLVLTLGITPQLGVLSKGILIALMFLGRVGGLTLVYAAMPGRKSAHAKNAAGKNKCRIRREEEMR